MSLVKNMAAAFALVNKQVKRIDLLEEQKRSLCDTCQELHDDNQALQEKVKGLEEYKTSQIGLLEVKDMALEQAEAEVAQLNRRRKKLYNVAMKYKADNAKLREVLDNIVMFKPVDSRYTLSELLHNLRVICDQAEQALKEVKL